MTTYSTLPSGEGLGGGGEGLGGGGEGLGGGKGMGGEGGLGGEGGAAGTERNGVEQASITSFSL